MQHSKKDGLLTLEQRYKIQAHCDVGKSIAEITAYIGKDRSVVFREIKKELELLLFTDANIISI
ncbi:helix-turn-helix domain-containing protein [Pedobacter alpinus]|uniref:Helix-turn-helix domain-containing protein n=1 Tax=Pedobacter alpinus TaxID=1590643 RepID=A0ABW5TXN2_9SPHI